MPTPLSSTWMVSLLAVMSTPTNTRPRVRLGVPDHIGQRLAQRGQRVIAELLGSRAVQRADQRDLGLEAEHRAYDRQGNAADPPTSIRCRLGPSPSRPVPAEWSPLNQALLVWCHHRVSPCGRSRTTWRAARSENTLRPALDQVRVSDSAETPAPAGVTFVERCRDGQASEMMISGLERKGATSAEAWHQLGQIPRKRFANPMAKPRASWSHARQAAP